MLIHVHIGAHKTGTTSIQAFLRGHADALAEGGICVPTAGVIDRRSGHHNIGWGLRGDPRYDPARGALDDLVTELAGSPAAAAVISSEDFEYLADRPAALSRLDRTLVGAGHEPRYILFVRRADTYALSLYAELRHHGLAIPFRDFAAEVLRTGKFVMRGDWSFHFDAGAFARKWRRAARGPLEVHSYDAAVAGEGVVPTFLSLIGSPGGLVRAGRDAEVLNTRKPADIPAVDRVVGGWFLRRRFAACAASAAAERPWACRPDGRPGPEASGARVEGAR